MGVTYGQSGYISSSYLYSASVPAPSLAPCSFYSLLFSFWSLFLWHVFIPLVDTQFLVTTTKCIISTFAWPLTRITHTQNKYFFNASFKVQLIAFQLFSLSFSHSRFLFLNVTLSITYIWSMSSWCFIIASVLTLSFQCLDIIWFFFPDRWIAKILFLATTRIV